MRNTAERVDLEPVEPISRPNSQSAGKRVPAISEAHGDPVSSTGASAVIGSCYPLLTIKEVRERMKVSQSTVYLWMSKGKFPKPLQLGDACVRWREEDIAAWLASKT